MSISSEINRISGNVSDALAAIANKGVTVPSGSNSDDLADLIGQISGGGTTYTTVFDEDMVMRSGSPGWSTYEYYLVPFLANQTYRVTFNGVPYTCETQAAPAGMTVDGYSIGNQGMAGGTDTGEPFLIYRADFGDPDPNHVQLELDSYATGTVHVKIELAQSGGGTSWETVYSGQINLSSDWGGGVNYASINPFDETIALNSVWRVTWDNVQYECTATWEGGDTTEGNPYAIGNYTYDGGQGGTEFPFYIQKYWGSHLMIVGASGWHTVVIEKQVSGGGGVDFPTFSITTDSNFTTVLSVTCDKTYSECLTLAENEQYQAVFEVDDGSPFIAGAVCADTPAGKLVYSAGTVDVVWLIVEFNENGTITGTLNPIPFRDSSDLTESGGTVTVPAGYYEQQETKTVASGTAGTPTATKGTVSNHSVSITPSVTNTTGYITGSTKTGTAVTVTASELASGNKEITSNGNNIDVVGYSTVSVNVPSGSGKNAQIAPGYGRTNQTAYTAVSGQSLTVAKTGTYDVYWSGYRSSTSGTSGSQLYIGGSSYGSENTTFDSTLTFCQSVHLSNVSLTQNQTVAVYARARGSSYYMYIFGLTIIEA